MSEIIASEMTETTNPKLKALADRVTNTLRLSLEKAIAHQADPTNYPLSADPNSFEQASLSYFNAYFESRLQQISAKLGPQKASEVQPLLTAQRKEVTTKVMTSLKAPQKERAVMYGDLAQVNLQLDSTVIQQVQAIRIPSTIKLSQQDLLLINPSIPGVQRISGMDGSGLTPQSTLNTLELRVRKLKCLDKTDVKNFLGIPLELDPDAIALSAIATDPTGQVWNIAETPMGRNFDNGRTETYSPSKSIARFALDRGTTWPRTYRASLTIAEKDDGGGLTVFSDRIFTEASRLVADALDDEVGETWAEAIARVIVQVCKELWKWIIEALGLNDDVYPPQLVQINIPSFGARFSGAVTSPERKIVYRAHGGVYELYYEWHLSNATPMSPASSGPRTGTGSGTGVISASLVASQPSEGVPLRLYWSRQRGDNFSTATLKGRQDAEAAGYSLIRTEGYVLPESQRNTVPLNLYWNSARLDNFVGASQQSKQEIEANGYGFVRTEGYIFSAQQPGTVPLKLYYGATRGDYFTTATEQGQQDARGAGYRLVRTEGYIFPKAIALRAHNGMYVCAEAGGGRELVVNRTWIGEWEPFLIIWLGGNQVALRAYNGQYLYPEDGGTRRVVAKATQIDPRTIFEMVHVGGSKLAFKAHNGMYLCAENGGGQEVVANRPRIDIWETFEIFGA
ncbi:hypothetical protein IQ273_03875 [Nodosilinea sp. LEGE 07298]|uniref:fascin domain-containing protein n=1 Tax=Nodosilinea sp. LEGE 07298 TaxID=2777970 RepID=UPI00187F3F55|nr:hypothetical protein [Nodosilinea sp. LEGE 07298]MBE9108555.1 hypothetical protein [Nodosilinea sp. LEGE 07298]